MLLNGITLKSKGTDKPVHSLTDNQLTMLTLQQPRLLSFWRSHTVIIETW